MQLHQIITKMQESSSIAILPHVSADGDAIGSSIALALALKQLDKDVHVYLAEEIPWYYRFLPGQEMASVYTGEAADFEYVIALDCGDLQRLGKRETLFHNAQATANIDHHPTNTLFAEWNHVLPTASSVGEMIYQVLGRLGVALTAEISTCLYVAVATDTGGFRYSNTTSVTHAVAGDLIQHGVQVAEVSQKLFETTTLQKIRMTAAALQRLEIHHEGRTAVLSIPRQLMAEAGAREEDTDGLVNMARSIVGVEVAVVVRETEKGDIKVNLRSKSYVDVSAIAQSHGGGGHKRAAGCTMDEGLDTVKNIILSDIEGML